jgi:hypothetical protein
MIIDLLIDSGAFSAFSCGKESKLSEYIGFVQCHRNIVHRYCSAALRNESSPAAISRFASDRCSEMRCRSDFG